MLETRDARLAVGKEPSLKRTSPVGRSSIRAGESGDEGDVKVYASLVTLRFMSLYGSLAVCERAMIAMKLGCSCVSLGTWGLQGGSNA